MKVFGEYLKKMGRNVMAYAQVVYNAKYFTFILFVGYFLVVLLSYIEYPLNNLVPFEGDGITLLSDCDFLKNEILQGEFPLWNNLAGNGMPVVADITTATFYPFKYISLLFSGAWFWLIFYALHLAMGATFTYKYLQIIQCKRFVAVFTSIIYLFSVHLGGGRKEHTMLVACAIYLPIILYFIEKYLQVQKKRYLLYSSIFMALQFFVGFPQYVVYTDLTVGFYLIAGGIRKKISLKIWFRDAIIWGISYFALIMVQLLPFIQLSQFYVSAGAGKTSFEVFRSLSLHPFRIIMMLFPALFDGQPWNPDWGTSGADIEIFLGLFVIVVLLYGIRYYMKSRKAFGAACVMLVTMLYACSGHIEWLARIIYRIPLLNSFRVPSRILFIFIFFAYVLFAVSLTKIMEEQRKDKLLKLVIHLLVLSVILMVAHMSSLLLLNGTGETYYSYEKIFDIYYGTIIILGIIAICIKIMDLDRERKKFIQYGILTVMFLTNLYEIYPLWRMAGRTDLTIDRYQKEMEDELTTNAKGYKALLASPYIDAGYENIFKCNRNVSLGISAINCYRSINNPQLCKLMTSASLVNPTYNFSGLYTVFLQIKRNLLCQNDLLSMLGVKYIIDQEGIISDNGYIYEKGHMKKELYSVKEEISVGDLDEMLIVPLTIKPETYYEIKFYVETDRELMFTGDLYELSYDNVDQDFSITLRPGLAEYKATIFSGEMEADVDGFFRMWLTDNEKINLQSFTISEYDADKIEGVYSLYYEDEKMKIYENKNVNEILYAPKSVKKIVDESQLYVAPLGLDLDEISYSKDIETEFENSIENVTVDNIVQKANSVTANVSCSEKTFINFSQNYFPEWRAYVDDERVDIYMVNGLIQGIEVPEGNHVVRFEYVPTMFYIGMGISLLSLMGILIFARREKILE